MIHYHGLPITPATAGLRAIAVGHAFVSYPHRDQLAMAAEVCQSIALDNGAFPAWRAGKPVQDWRPFYEWAAECKRLPVCDFAVVPDVIDGDEATNDALAAEWPLPKWFGAPVWHMHESFDRLERLANTWPRICLGSSGEFATLKTAAWWGRMAQAMRVLCNDNGEPLCKLHGLRMLDPEVFTRLPLSSADSTNIGQNVGIDQTWKGNYMPVGREMKDWRALSMRNRIEASNSAVRWSFTIPEYQPEDQGSLI
ncbi:MAG: hypothetical protein V4792_09920 [Pseudomonadota bacterium]